MTSEIRLQPSADRFLEALNLPTRHPYVDVKGCDPGKESTAVGTTESAPSPRKFHIVDYFLTPSMPPDQSSKNSIIGDAAAPLRLDGGLDPSRYDKFPLFAAPGSKSSKSSVGIDENGSFPSDLLIEYTTFDRNPFEATRLFTIRMVEVGRQVGPCLLSTFHLCFLRLFAPVMWLFAVAFLVIAGPAESNKNRRKHAKVDGRSFASIVALFCSMLMGTDAMYVLEYTRPPLVGLYFATTLVVAKRSRSRRAALSVILPLTVAMLLQIALCDLNPPTIQPGLYYDSNNPISAAIVNRWPVDKRTYDDGRGTPWLITGDSRTGIPFVVISLPEQKYVRRWVPSPVDKEAVILDIAFPPDGEFRPRKPIYMILHGLNGGSSEEYVKDFTIRRTAEGSTVAVMVTRGLMDSPVIGENLPHFARMSDIDATARALRAAASPNQIVAAVGYSMGGICLANYAARSGTNCPLDAAVSISGALDTRRQPEFHRSEKLWQPFLSKVLRETITTKFRGQLEKKMTAEQIKKVERAGSIVALDQEMFVVYNGFRNLDHYYSEMGALGDHIRFDGEAKEAGRIANVSIPLLTVNALDDPVGYWGCALDPAKVSKSGKGNIIVLLTQKGGHVGWPLSMNPGKEGWKWMSDVASSFVESVSQSR